MKSFDELYEWAVQRKGQDELEARLPTPLSAVELQSAGDDRYLSMMARRVFQAGFVWRVIESKWDGFEEAFHGFDPRRVGHLTDEELAELGEDTRIVRNGQKILATVKNAQFVLDISEEHGSFGAFLASWPDDDTIGLWSVLAKQGARLGGATGPYFLRGVGKDTFTFSTDVVAALIREGVVPKKPTSKKDLLAAQEAFNTWRAQSGRPHGHTSVILACTVDSPGR